MSNLRIRCRLLAVVLRRHHLGFKPMTVSTAGRRAITIVVVIIIIASIKVTRTLVFIRTSVL